MAWCTDLKNVTFKKIHWPPSEVVEIKRSFSRSLRPNFVFLLAFMSFYLEFSSFLVSVKIQHRWSFGLFCLNGLKNGSAKYILQKLHEIAQFLPRINMTYILLGGFELIQIFLLDMCEYVVPFSPISEMWVANANEHCPTWHWYRYRKNSEL